MSDTKYKNSVLMLEEAVQTKLSVISRFQSPFQLSDMLNELELHPREIKRVAAALRNLGYKNRVLRVDGKLKKVWQIIPYS